MKHNYPIITVEWADHFFEEEDASLEEVIKTSKQRFTASLTGYLIHESKYALAIAANIWQDGSFREVNYIMKKAIIKRSDKP